MGRKLKAKIKTIDEYLAALSHDKRAALERLRKTIQAAVPRAEECISYQLPAFRLDGRLLVWFGAAANHCAFCPGAVVEAHKGELKDYDTSKGTIRFHPANPLPATLVRKLLKARIAKNAATQPQPAQRAARRR
ncbi:MAG: iron chaperone [Candidatus Binatia bacterium]